MEISLTIVKKITVNDKIILKNDRMLKITIINENVKKYKMNKIL